MVGEMVKLLSVFGERGVSGCQRDTGKVGGIARILKRGDQGAYGGGDGEGPEDDGFGAASGDEGGEQSVNPGVEKE
jgi:hypothetical protein